MHESYNCIMGRPFTAALDTATLPPHLKLKYHNLHEEKVILYTDLVATSKIPHALHKDQGEGTYMEINMTSLNYQLQNMNLHTPQCG